MACKGKGIVDQIEKSTVQYYDGFSISALEDTLEELSKSPLNRSFHMYTGKGGINMFNDALVRMNEEDTLTSIAPSFKGIAGVCDIGSFPIKEIDSFIKDIEE